MKNYLWSAGTAQQSASIVLCLLNRSFRPTITFLTFLLAGNLIQAAPVIAQERLARTLTVTGQGEETVQTSLVQVRLGVEVQGKTAQAAQQEVARRSESVVALLRSRQVDKLETSGVSLNPNYSYQEGRPPVITSYTATNIVSFQVPAVRAGAILDEAVKAGATRIDGISFIATDSALETARQQAIREAIQEAQAEAGVVLATLDLRQQEIVGIQVNGAAPPPFIPGPKLEAVQQDATARTPIIPGEQEVQVSVTLQIRY